MKTVQICHKQGRINNYVVEVAYTSRPFQTFWQTVYHTLKRNWRIAKSKLHDSKLVQVVGGDENGLLTVGFIDSNVPEIDGREIFRPIKGV